MSSPPPDDSQTTGPPASDPLNETSLAATRALGERQAAGTSIGRYQLLQKIGEGGMGEVDFVAQEKVKTILETQRLIRRATGSS